MRSKKDLTGPTLLEMSGFPTNQELERDPEIGMSQCNGPGQNQATTGKSNP